MTNHSPNPGDGYILIEPKDFEKYAPKLATDEFYLPATNEWWLAEGDSGVFGIGNIYRRKINPAVVEQGKPVEGGVDICSLVKADLEARALKGERTYGKRLQAFNGRDGLTDLYQEILDSAMYLRQALEEADKDKSNRAKMHSALTEISKNIGSTHAAELAAKTLKEAE